MGSLQYSFCSRLGCSTHRLRRTVHRQKVALCRCEGLNTLSTSHGEVLYCRSSIIIAAFSMLFSSPAVAQTPKWVSNLTSHTAMKDIPASQREEVACMALAIYFEARGESTRGQQAVGNVVLNRTKDARYPNTACGVLFQRGQFSFIRPGSPSVPKTPHLWESAIRMAHSIITGRIVDCVRGATSFRQRRLRKSGFTIGNHVFF